MWFVLLLSRSLNRSGGFSVQEEAKMELKTEVETHLSELV